MQSDLGLPFTHLQDTHLCSNMLNKLQLLKKNIAAVQRFDYHILTSRSNPSSLCVYMQSDLGSPFSHLQDTRMSFNEYFLIKIEDLK